MLWATVNGIKLSANGSKIRSKNRNMLRNLGLLCRNETRSKGFPARGNII